MQTTVVCRPIKIGFVVNPNDKAAILEAISLNTFLWGGVFNPLIPAYSRRPSNWSRLPLEQFDRKEVLRGYLEAFDPDFVVPLGEVKCDASVIGCRRQLSVSELLGDVEKYGGPNVGIGLFEIIEHFISTELRFVRKAPLRFKMPRWTRQGHLFFSAVFGKLPDNLERWFEHRYHECLGVEHEGCTWPDFASFLSPDNLFLRRLSSLYVRRSDLSAHGRHCVFLLNSNKSADILDYWNLRAIGWKVLPVPLQATSTEAVKQHAAQFIERQFAPHFNNPDIYHNSTLLISRNCSEQDGKAFLKSLNLSPPQGTTQPKVLLQPWYPRIWEHDFRRSDGVTCCSLDAGRQEKEHSDDADTFRTPVASPECLDDLRRQAGPRFANDVLVRSYSSNRLLAEIVPESDDRMRQAIGAIGHRDWSFSTRGLVYLARYSEESIWMGTPDGQAVFQTWLEGQGWNCNPSSAGHLVLQR